MSTTLYLGEADQPRKAVDNVIPVAAACTVERNVILVAAQLRCR